MNVKKWWPVLFPMTVWLLFKVISFLFGFTPWPDLSQLALLGETYPFITAFAFGIWIGAASHKDFSLGATLRNAIMIAFIIGIAELLLTIILINTSQSFLTYVASIYTQIVGDTGISIIDLVISTWVGGMFVTVPAAAAAYLLLGGEKKRR